MDYKANQIARLLGLELERADSKNPRILSAAFDSRSNQIDANTLFVAIKSKSADGHSYCKQAYQKGCRVFLLEKEISLPSDSIQLIVDNTINSLQHLASWHLQNQKTKVVAITGSHGKTIVKEWLHRLLSYKYKSVKSPKSYNSQLGVPISVLATEAFHEIGVFEAGISQPEEMQKLEQILKPDIGIITNIGSPHQANFKNRKEKLNEKLALFKHCPKLLYCGNDPEIAMAIDQAIIQGQLPKNIELISWGNKGNTYQIEKDSAGKVRIAKDKNTFEFEFPKLSAVYEQNAIHAICCALELQVSADFIQKELYTFNSIPMRLQYKKGINNCVLVNDSYSADIDSLDVALGYLDQVSGQLPKTLILSDFEQQHLNVEKWRDLLKLRIKQHGISQVLLVGSLSMQVFKDLELKNVQCFTSSKALSKYLKVHQPSKQSILIKGARHFQLDKIESLLQEKTHETLLEINLSAIRYNLAFYRSKLAKHTKVMVMVKAQSYGAGIVEVAKVLQNQGADYLSVAYTDEGVELREAGIQLPIMVLNPEQAGYLKMIQYRLEPEVYSFKVLDELLNFLKKEQVQRPLPIHINLDTGMKRLGFEEDQLAELNTQLYKNKELLCVKSIYSHLVASDEPAQTEFTNLQIELFGIWAEKIEANLSYPIMKHICNSAGILHYPNAHFNMVRLGLGLYGFGAHSLDKQELQNAVSLKSSISQIKKIKKGDSIGYSRAWITDCDTTIATIPIGYADGFKRSFSNGKGQMLVNGKPAKVVGNVCMDMCMLDITNITAQEGDEVIIFNSAQSIEHLAHAANTISYEIISSISPRVKRVYIDD